MEAKDIETVYREYWKGKLPEKVIEENVRRIYELFK